MSAQHALHEPPLHVVIMAGGAGTRFWPESRATRPKQLLRLVGEQSLLSMTLARTEGLAPIENVLVVTNAALLDGVAADLPNLPAKNLIGEPCKRDTAPCIGLAAALIARHDPEATLLVTPADHLIEPVERFQQSLRAAARLVAQSPGRIVTLGIPPTYPAETFGYIERGARLDPRAAAGSELDGLDVYDVVRFREKPARQVAERFLAQGSFYWNSGIFVWKARTILAALEQRQPETFARLMTIVEHWESADRQAVFEREFAAIRPISIDYAVMEHARDVTVIAAPFAWDDLGAWQAWARVAGHDAAGNATHGKQLVLHSQGSIVRSTDDHLVVALGLKDMLVVHTPDVTLVANKHDEEAIRQVVKVLEERGWREYL